MSSSALAAGIRHLRVKLAAQQRKVEDDEQLLHAFTSQRDESAFAILVRRRVLGHEQDAEDALQLHSLYSPRALIHCVTKSRWSVSCMG
jgi:hypothetical protein